MAVPGNLGIYFSQESKENELVTKPIDEYKRPRGNAAVAPKKKTYNNYTGAVLGIFALGFVIYLLNGK